ncbi:hypothetical protein EIP91_011963 [Steccherinum ochraceum]|uniref:Uncharacterized protein n=1 Tax=Steccherinum ochraceum TaxID=92696 RepID=A0A4V6N777_9APHY|nr:hypothetical protein EIP91_011963 [Steccherinum ochraceum]
MAMSDWTGQRWLCYNLDKEISFLCRGSLAKNLYRDGFRTIGPLLIRLAKQDQIRGAQLFIKNARWRLPQYTNLDGVRDQYKNNVHLDKNYPLGLLHQLPPEIITMILLAIENVVALACISLTNTALFLEGYPLLMDIAQEAYSWAGDRLICVGSGCNIDDIPQGVFNATEIQQMTLKAPTTMQDDDTADDAAGDNKYSHLYEALEDTKAGIGPPDWISILPSPFELPVESLQVVDPKVRSMLAGLPSSDRFLYGDLRDAMTYGNTGNARQFLLANEERPWVLCNLTTGEYVRASAIANLLEPAVLQDDKQRYRYIYGPNFAERLNVSMGAVARFCWSSDPSFSVAEAYKGDIHRGVWAGHRFEIISLDSIRPLGNGREWKDVSEEVAGEMKALWISEFGAEWRDNL